jgi:hypothetical protein
MNRKSWSLIAGAVLVVGVIMGTSYASATSSGGPNHRTIKTLEVNKSDTLVDVAPSGESIGDEDVIRADLVNPQTNAPLGFTQDFCVEVVVQPLALECYGTMHLADGVVNIAGSFFGNTDDNTWGVTGGTGEYQTVHGYMTLPPAPNGNLFHNLYLVMR